MRSTTSDLGYCQKEVAREFFKRISRAGYSELKALEVKLQRHYDAGTLAQKDFARLDVWVMEELARFDCGRQAK